MQVLGLERDYVITSSLVCGNCNIRSLGTNIPFNFVFFFRCRESSTTVLTGLMMTLRIYEALSRI